MRSWIVAAMAGLAVAACASEGAPNVWARGCRLHMASAPAMRGEGVVEKLLDPAEAMALLAQTEASTGAPINRAYVNNTRAVLRIANGREATVHVPPGMSVAVGDRVAYQGSYRSPDEACSYVPNLVIRKF